MAEKLLERFYARLIFTYPDTEKGAGREIVHIYNREDLDALYDIPRHEWDNAQFIMVGDKLTLENKKCVVKNIIFKLEDHLHMMTQAAGYGVNTKSPSDPSNFNCSVVVVVDWVS